MQRHLGWHGAILLCVILAGCGPVRPATPRPQPPLPPTGAWTVKLTQSGGFIGVLMTVDVSSGGALTAQDHRSGRSVTNTVPPETIARLDQMISKATEPLTIGKSSRCADSFNYTLDLTSTRGAIQVQMDDTTIGASGLEALINLLQQLRDDALRAKP
jgi:hypothetical protein